MHLIYEAIGRLVVRAVWWRFDREIKIAGGVGLVLAVATGWALSHREPPEG